MIFLRIETLGMHVAQDPLQRVAGGHTAIDQRQLVAAVHQVDVAIGIIGKPEGVRDPSAHYIHLVRDTHRFTILLSSSMRVDCAARSSVRCGLS